MSKKKTTAPQDQPEPPMPQDVVEALHRDRDGLVERIMRAMQEESWGNHPLTRAFAESLQVQMQTEAEGMTDQIENGDKPISTGDQMRHKGRRMALQGVIDRLSAAARSTLDAIEAARHFEQQHESELGMHYVPPKWDSYEAEARARLGLDGDTAKAA